MLFGSGSYEAGNQVTINGKGRIGGGETNQAYFFILLFQNIPQHFTLEGQRIGKPYILIRVAFSMSEAIKSQLAGAFTAHHHCPGGNGYRRNTRFKPSVDAFLHQFTEVG